MDEQDEGVMDFCFFFWEGRVDEEIGKEMCRFFSWQFELEDKAAIPKPGVMSGAVSEHGEVVHQRAEGLLVHPKRIGNGLPDRGLA